MLFIDVDVHDAKSTIAYMAKYKVKDSVEINASPSAMRPGTTVNILAPWTTRTSQSARESGARECGARECGARECGTRPQGGRWPPPQAAQGGLRPPPQAAAASQRVPMFHGG